MSSILAQYHGFGVPYFGFLRIQPPPLGFNGKAIPPALRQQPAPRVSYSRPRIVTAERLGSRPFASVSFLRPVQRGRPSGFIGQCQRRVCAEYLAKPGSRASNHCIPVRAAQSGGGGWTPLLGVPTCVLHISTLRDDEELWWENSRNMKVTVETFGSVLPTHFQKCQQPTTTPAHRSRDSKLPGDRLPDCGNKFK